MKRTRSLSPSSRSLTSVDTDNPPPIPNNDDPPTSTHHGALEPVKENSSNLQLPPDVVSIIGQFLAPPPLPPTFEPPDVPHEDSKRWCDQARRHIKDCHSALLVNKAWAIGMGHHTIGARGSIMEGRLPPIVLMARLHARHPPLRQSCLVFRAPEIFALMRNFNGISTLVEMLLKDMATRHIPVAVLRVLVTQVAELAQRPGLLADDQSRLARFPLDALDLLSSRGFTKDTEWFGQWAECLLRHAPSLSRRQQWALLRKLQRELNDNFPQEHHHLRERVQHAVNTLCGASTGREPV
jgi:hypothetical protein